MDENTPSIDEYLQVRRILAAIAFANDDIDEQERMVIASSLGGASHLSAEQIKILIDDAKERPDVRHLASEIHDKLSIRQFIIDIMALASLKTEWHQKELEAVYLSIESMHLNKENKRNVKKSFDALCKVSRSI